MFRSIPSIREKLFSDDRVIFTVDVNWPWILTFVCFWSYGIYGELSSFNIKFHLLQSGLFLVPIILFTFLASSKDDQYRTSLKIHSHDILIFLTYFFILFPLSFEYLTNSLTSDQIYHAQYSNAHSMNLTIYLSDKFEILKKVTFSRFIQIINLLILLGMALLIKIIRSRSLPVKAASISILFILLRLFHFYYGFKGGFYFAYTGPHPPFRLFPLWLSSTLLGPSSFSFRLPQFIGLLLLMVLLARIARSKIPFGHAWLFGLISGTIPVLWHVGILAEQSIWTAVCWTLILVLLLIVDHEDNLSYFAMISAVCTATLMRQSAFIILNFIFSCMFIDLLRSRRIRLAMITSWIPVLIIAPFIAKSIISGTPATYRPGESAYFAMDASTIERVIFSVKSLMAPKAIYNSVFLPWVSFGFLAFWPRKFKWEDSLRALFTAGFFMSSFYVFYSIRPILWGTGRYQAEYIVPFSIVGFFLALNFGQARSVRTARIVPLLLVVLLLFNVYTFLALPGLNADGDILKTELNEKFRVQEKYSVLSEVPFDYDRAYERVKESGFAGSTYVVGITYGVFNEILYDFSVSEVSRTQFLLARQNYYKRMKRISWLGADPVSIHQSRDIDLVLISDVAHQEVLEGLKKMGWKKWENFRNERHRSTIYGMIRPGI